MSVLERRFLKALEPIVACYWMTPSDAVEEYTAIGLDDPMACYVTGRAAPLGRATAATVASVFYNFDPRVIDEALWWDRVEPEAVLEARARGVRRLLGRLLEDAPHDVAAAAASLREAAAGCRPEGRPLFAANAALPWPEHPLEALWHGGNLLREYRGDGHIAVLVAAGLTGVEALALNVAYTGWNRDFFYLLRGWPQEAYDAAHQTLRARGFLDDENAITDAGMKFREMLEIETDRATATVFQGIGPARATDLLAVIEPIGQMVVERKGVSRSVSRIGGTAG